MRRWLLPLVLLAAPASAEAPALYLVAPAGECAGEEHDLVLRPLPSPRSDEAPPPAIPAFAAIDSTQQARSR